jgi:hypothetical protein
MKGHPRFITVTPGLLEAAATRGCGFTDRQIAILDGRGKPKQGWRQRAIGKRLSYERGHELLFAARRPKQRPKPGSQEESRALALLDSCADPPRLRQTALRSTAMMMREPISDIPDPSRCDDGDVPPWADLASIDDATAGEDTACPVFHGDDLGRLNCQLCSTPVLALADPWLELERIANDIAPTMISARIGIMRAAKALRRVDGTVSREITVVVQFVRALDVAMHHEEALDA